MPMRADVASNVSPISKSFTSPKTS